MILQRNLISSLHFLFFVEKVAIKILDKSKLDSKTQTMLTREIGAMEKLHHPNLVQLFEVIENFSKIHLVLEFAAGGELYQKISNQGKLIEPVAKSLFAQIISAIDHMVSFVIKTRLYFITRSIIHLPSPNFTDISIHFLIILLSSSIPNTQFDSIQVTFLLIFPLHFCQILRIYYYFISQLRRHLSD